jgi:ABC-2 type transport system ATP-binding protein
MRVGAGLDPEGPSPGPSGPPAISCEGVSAGYLGRRVLDRVSFEIRTPAIYVVLGPNGAGKTTLFRTLAGILRPTEGKVAIGGEPVGRQLARDRLHFLSHIEGIPDGMRVRDALRFYARIERASEADVERVLDLLEIRGLADRFFTGLSAGQRKRVSIARIFLREREIYLLDEPTTNLDPKVAREIRDLVLTLSQERIVLYSSHNLFEAREIGRYVLALKEGRVNFFGPIADLRSARYRVGLRPLGAPGPLSVLPKEGEYYVRDLAGPEEVPALLRALEAEGVQLRELRELGNPLEDLFT